MNPRKLLLLALVLSFVALAFPAAADSGNLRYTITVSKFDNRSGWSGQWNLGDAWGSVMTDLLNQSGRFIVLGESDMRNEAMQEQDFGASGRTAQGAKTPTIGQMTPAQLLVKGEITHVEHRSGGGRGGIRIKRIRVGGSKESAEVNATIYVVDSTTGQVLASKSVTGKSNKKGASFGYSGSNFGTGFEAFKKDSMGKAVTAAVEEAVEFLTAQLPSIPWTGSVVMVKDGRVYINRGTREGVGSDNTFVIGTSDVIRDPDTGEVLDEVMEEVARVKVVSVKEKLAICEVISGEASAIGKGMAVHPGS